MPQTEEKKPPKLEEYGRICIYKSSPVNLYEVSAPKFSDKEKALADLLIDYFSLKIQESEFLRRLDKGIAVNFSALLKENIIADIEKESMAEKIPKAESAAKIISNLVELIKKYAAFVKSAREFSEYVFDYSVGYGVVGLLLSDDNLEEVMINGYDTSIFVFHRKHGICRTNIIVKENEFLERLIKRIAASVGKAVSPNMPFLDARLPDGSRANATVQYITPIGPTLTIRKFKQQPFSVTQLIQSKMLSSEVAAFLWVMVDGLGIEPMNLIITGGSGTGKTTLLNALSSFINFRERVVTIEDTPELQFNSRDNWIQMESKPKTGAIEEITMNDLLKNALRMRPDRILVGEVRGPEAQTLFVAMDVGHNGCMGTLHSNNSRETLIRLKSAPMNVPEAMLPLLNLVVVLERRYVSNKGLIRRVSEISEINRMEEKVLLGEIYSWEQDKDVVKATPTPSKIVETMAERAGMTKKQLMDEILVRQRILEWMLEKELFEIGDVEQMVQDYYSNPNKVIELVSH